MGFLLTFCVHFYSLIVWRRRMLRLSITVPFIHDSVTSGPENLLTPLVPKPVKYIEKLIITNVIVFQRLSGSYSFIQSEKGTTQVGGMVEHLPSHQNTHRVHGHQSFQSLQQKSLENVVEEVKSIEFQISYIFSSERKVWKKYNWQFWLGVTQAEVCQRSHQRPGLKPQKLKWIIRFNYLTILYWSIYNIPLPNLFLGYV